MDSEAFVGVLNAFRDSGERNQAREPGKRETKTPPLSYYPAATCKCTSSRRGKEELSVTVYPLAGDDDDTFEVAIFSNPSRRRSGSQFLRFSKQSSSYYQKLVFIIIISVLEPIFLYLGLGFLTSLP